MRAVACSEHCSVVSKALTRAEVRRKSGADSMCCGGRPRVARGDWGASLLLSASGGRHVRKEHGPKAGKVSLAAQSRVSGKDLRYNQ